MHLCAGDVQVASTRLPAGRRPAAGQVPRRAPRRWIVPSALLSDTGCGAFDGYRILSEVQDKDAAYALFQLYRAVTLWSSAAGGSRDGLFAETSRSAVLRSALVALGAHYDAVLAASTVFRAVGTSAKASARVAAGCDALARAASARDWRATALAMAIAAACAEPSDPERAASVGKFATEARHVAVAETWLRRSIALARRSRNWTAYSRAHLDLGRMAVRAGMGARARFLLMRALRIARRYSVREVRAAAAGELHRLARAAGEYEAACVYGIRAVRAYGGDAREAAELKQSLAELHLDAGHPGAALELLEEVLRRTDLLPLERARTLVTAVAALGRIAGPPPKRRVQNYADEAVRLIAGEELSDRPGAFRALLDLASAVAATDLPHAERLAWQAQGVATRSEEAELVQEARALVTQIGRERRRKRV